MANHWLGVDTGGTFTDFVYYDGESIRIHKVLSTPQSPEKAILQGIAEMQISTQGLHLIHGSTVATNAVLEGKGVNTLYVTNKGFADVLTIGRQARRELYNLTPHPREPLNPKSTLAGNKYTPLCQRRVIAAIIIGRFRFIIAADKTTQARCGSN